MSARSLNKVQLIGNLTRDPEMRFTTNGTAVATFGIATNKSWKNADGEVQEIAEFHNIVSWNKIAEICQKLLSKGMKVYIEGSLTTRSWDDEATGVKKYKTEVRVDEMILLDSKGKSGAGIEGAPAESKDNAPAKGNEKPTETTVEEDPLEELPF